MKEKIMKTIITSVMLLSLIHFHQIVSAYNQTLNVLHATSNALQKLPPLIF